MSLCDAVFDITLSGIEPRTYRTSEASAVTKTLGTAALVCCLAMGVEA